MTAKNLMNSEWKNAIDMAFREQSKCAAPEMKSVQWGFEDAVRQVLAMWKHDDNGWWGAFVHRASGRFNTVPDGMPSVCLPVLVANSCGSFYSVQRGLRAVRRHLITCHGTTRTVLIIADDVSPGWLPWQRSLPDFCTHQQQGVVFLVAAPVEGVLSPQAFACSDCEPANSSSTNPSPLRP